MSHDFYLIIMQPNKNEWLHPAELFITSESWGMRISLIPANLSMSCYLDEIAPLIVIFNLQ